MTDRELSAFLDEASRRQDAGQEPFDSAMIEQLNQGVLNPAVRRYLRMLVHAWRMSSGEAEKEANQELWKYLLTPPARDGGGNKELIEEGANSNEGVPASSTGTAKPRWRQAQEARPHQARYFRQMVDNFLFGKSREDSSWRLIDGQLRSLARREDTASLGFEIIPSVGAKASTKPAGFRRIGCRIVEPPPLSETEMDAWVNFFGESEFCGTPEPEDCARLLAELLAARPPEAPRESEAIRIEDANQLIRRVWRLPQWMTEPKEPEAENWEKRLLDSRCLEDGSTSLERLEVWRAFVHATTELLAKLDGNQLPDRPPKPGVPNDDHAPLGSVFAGFWLWRTLPYGPEGDAPYVLRQHTTHTGIRRATLDGRISRVEEALRAAAARANLHRGDECLPDAMLLDYLRHRFAAWKPPGVTWAWTPPAWLEEAEAAFDRAGNQALRSL
jgi:hypothetical protein